MGIFNFFNKKENKDKYIKWLKKNAGERMDANRKELFKPDRCDFHLDRYEFASKYIKDGNKVLDVASGTGYGASNMRKNNPAIDIIGVGIDEMAVEYANFIYGGGNFIFKRQHIKKIILLMLLLRLRLSNMSRTTKDK